MTPTDDRVHTAEGHAYRRRSPLEVVGAAVARLVPESGLRRRLVSHSRTAVGPAGGDASTLPGGEPVRGWPENRVN